MTSQALPSTWRSDLKRQINVEIFWTTSINGLAVPPGSKEEILLFMKESGLSEADILHECQTRGLARTEDTIKHVGTWWKVLKSRCMQHQRANQHSDEHSDEHLFLPSVGERDIRLAAHDSNTLQAYRLMIRCKGSEEEVQKHTPPVDSSSGSPISTDRSQNQPPATLSETPMWNDRTAKQTEPLVNEPLDKALFFTHFPQYWVGSEVSEHLSVEPIRVNTLPKLGQFRVSYETEAEKRRLILFDGTWLQRRRLRVLEDCPSQDGVGEYGEAYIAETWYLWNPS